MKECRRERNRAEEGHDRGLVQRGGPGKQKEKEEKGPLILRLSRGAVVFAGKCFND